jgi:hypothetical protein
MAFSEAAKVAAKVADWHAIYRLAPPRQHPIPAWPPFRGCT